MAVTFPSQPSSLSAPKAQLHRQHAQECPVWHQGWEVTAAPSSGAERFKTGSPVIILLQLTRGWKVEEGIRGKGGNYRGATGRQGWELGGEIAPAADGSQHPNKNQQVTPRNVPSQSFTEDSMLHPKGKSAPTGFIYSQIKNTQVMENGCQHCRAWGGFGEMSRMVLTRPQIPPMGCGASMEQVRTMHGLGCIPQWHPCGFRSWLGSIQGLFLGFERL